VHNDDNNFRCVQCGNVLQQVAPQYAAPGAAPNIKSHMADAVVATLFCCLPLGIVAIVHAAKVNKLVAVGDYAGAEKASKQAKTYAWIAAGLGLLTWILSSIIRSGSF
jgi:hypothetical protein